MKSLAFRHSSSACLLGGNSIPRYANSPHKMNDPELLTPAEAALMARCSLRTLRRAYSSGSLPAYRSPGGRSVKLLRQEVVAFFLAEAASEPSSPRLRPRRRYAKRPSLVSSPTADPLSVEVIRSRRM